MTDRGRLIRLAVMRRRELFLVIETITALTLASLAVRLLPFRRIVALADFGAPRSLMPPAERNLARIRLRWAITACARRLPWRPLCFPQGLAAHWL